MNSWVFYTLSFLMIMACVMDLTTRKVSNLFVVFTAITCFSLNFYFTGLQGIGTAVSSFAITFLVLLPLYILKVFGGGDFKFFVALSFLLSPLITTDILILSIIWGGLIGLLQILFAGDLKTLLYSLAFKVKGLSLSTTNAKFKIPYTIAYLLGWLTWYRHGGVL